MTPEPFTLHVPDEVLNDLRARLEGTRWPDEVADAGWTLGTIKPARPEDAPLDLRPRHRRATPLGDGRTGAELRARMMDVILECRLIDSEPFSDTSMRFTYEVSGQGRPPMTMTIEIDRAHPLTYGVVFGPGDVWADIDEDDRHAIADQALNQTLRRMYDDRPRRPD